LAKLPQIPHPWNPLFPIPWGQWGVEVNVVHSSVYPIHIWIGIWGTHSSVGLSLLDLQEKPPAPLSNHWCPIPSVGWGCLSNHPLRNYSNWDTDWLLIQQEKAIVVNHANQNWWAYHMMKWLNFEAKTILVNHLYIWISSLQFPIDNTSKDAQHCSPLERAPNLHPQISNSFKEYFNCRKSPGIEINSRQFNLICNSTSSIMVLIDESLSLHRYYMIKKVSKIECLRVVEPFLSAQARSRTVSTSLLSTVSIGLFNSFFSCLINVICSQLREGAWHVD